LALLDAPPTRNEKLHTFQKMQSSFMRNMVLAINPMTLMVKVNDAVASIPS
jgi:hypothetical protein